MKTPTLCNQVFFQTVFLIDWAYLVLYASCCQIFSFEWLLDAFLWLSSISQLTFQLSFYTDYQNLGNISLKSLCRSKITFLILFLFVIIKFFVCKWSQAIKKVSYALCSCSFIHQCFWCCTWYQQCYFYFQITGERVEWLQAGTDWCFFLWKLSFGL